MQQSNKYWLLIEWYVYISIKENEVLLFNTLNSDFIKYQNNKLINQLCNQIKHNGYITELNENEIHIQEIASFINDLKKKFIGDIMEQKMSQNPPFTFYPILNNQQSYQTKENELIKLNPNTLLSNLNEINIYVNYYIHESNIYKDAYKQFLYPISSTIQNDINLSLIDELLFAIKSSPIDLINILGGNILDYENISQLLNLLSQSKTFKIFYFRIQDLINKYGLHFNHDILNNLNDSFYMNCIIDFLMDINSIYTNLKIIKETFDISEFIFIVKNENELLDAQKIISQLKITSFKMCPYYDGNNISFFEKYVFLKENSILNRKIPMEVIFANQVLSRNMFGKLTMLVNGDLYSNLNIRTLGNLKENTLSELIMKEMEEGNTWTKTRNKLTPCQNCIFESLCPSISNYELFIGINNLCMLKTN